MFDRELASGAFETALKAQQAETLDELDAIVAPTIQQLGFKHFCGVEVFGAGGQRRASVRHGVNHAGWQAHYLQCALARHDAAIAEIGATTEPFFRSELPARRGGLTAPESRIAEEARAFGVSDSLFVPQHHVDGTLGAVVFIAGDEIDRTPCLRTAAHLLAVQYGLLARRLLRRPSQNRVDQVTLTRRQLECLKWVAAGKTSPDIGDILGLSARTVDTYVGTACERLGVRTRAQAIKEALTQGLLPP